MTIEGLWQTDLIGLISPVMTGPLLYPVLIALGALDGIVPIIPSEAVLITAGLFSRTGTPLLLLVVLASAAGVMLGDHLVYALSRSTFGPRLLGRFPRVSAAVDAGGRQLERRAGRVIVISRFVPGGRVTTNIACGTTRLPLSRFTPASAIAALAWAAYHGGLGVLGGAAFIQNPLFGLLLCLAVSCLAGGAVPLARRLLTRRATRPGPRAGSEAPVVVRTGGAPIRQSTLVDGRARSVNGIWRATAANERQDARRLTGASENVRLPARLRASPSLPPHDREHGTANKAHPRAGTTPQRTRVARRGMLWAQVPRSRPAAGASEAGKRNRLVTLSGWTRWRPRSPIRCGGRSC
ncbi:membrane protein DedA with SNARE-associated domain [Catenuloplanes nepalensis]|uniref:Membrane protein DedA with SNARE-associated domain n=1 Tax=Catenuloplanes nepalensis TaxID=587533 RepID=A0ABT9MU07_9ACTN|nr:VTT domain-containing protein [Catenuloplanes nepalensis]MDP9794909.1 membrane protein DedA with SNARE-associated domain [Catenuloplanes nepalensis]